MEAKSVGCPCGHGCRLICCESIMLRGLEGLTLDRMHEKDLLWSSVKLYLYPPQPEDYQLD